MIHVTHRAAQQIRQLTSPRDSSCGLRLAIEKGGCAGLSYGMTVTPPQPGDQSVELSGARIFLAPESVDLLKGCTLDYEDELTHTGFKIINPKAKQTCGCGTSFEA